MAAKRAAASRTGFTLVELLVVIAIIAILAALLVVAAQSAIRAANQARITATLTQLDTAFEDYKVNVQAYPPNAQIDGTGAANPIDEQAVLATFKRHFKKAFPQHREPDALLSAMCGLGQAGTPGANLEGGMNAAEAVVFWLGGFSDDPKYPISGPGGPSYQGNSFDADPIENRSWALDVDVTSLGPRNDANFFDQTDGRYLIYNDPRNPSQQRRINFWFLKAPGSPAPYVYFDASRGSSAEPDNDPAAVTQTTPFTGADADTLNALSLVYAVKQRKSDASSNKPYQFANTGTFQILHAGIDEDWGVFPRVNPNVAAGASFDQWLMNPETTTVDAGLPVYPTGPWTLELADTLTTFTSGTLEDAQP